MIRLFISLGQVPPSCWLPPTFDRTVNDHLLFHNSVIVLDSNQLGKNTDMVMPDQWAFGLRIFVWVIEDYCPTYPYFYSKLHLIRTINPENS